MAELPWTSRMLLMLYPIPRKDFSIITGMLKQKLLQFRVLGEDSTLQNLILININNKLSELIINY